jgi:hypothetical protein
VLGSETGVAHHHLECPVPEQLCDSAPNPLRPSRVYWQKYGGCNARSSPHRREDRRVPHRLTGAARLLQDTEATVFSRMVRGSPFLVWGK